MAVRPEALPEHALLRACMRDGGYTDCWAVDAPGAITHARYVEAFYTTWLFKLERLVLGLAIARPSTDEQAHRLGAGTLDAFAAWKVEQRAENQLLLADIFGNTCSWLMVEPLPDGNTRLYFGSGVVPKARKRQTFSLLLWFHKLYSRLLLGAARRRLL